MNIKKIITVGIIGIGSVGMIGIGCIGSLYNYTDKGRVQINNERMIRVYIDKEFKKEEVESIKKAINEWNYVLNGMIGIKVWREGVDLVNEDSIGEVGEEIRKIGEGWAIKRIDEDVQGMMVGALAYVNELGGHIMVIEGGKIGDRDLKTIVLHEMGHLLGAPHVAVPSLMYPYANGDQYNCVDKLTAYVIAKRNEIDKERMNYCDTPDFK